MPNNILEEFVVKISTKRGTIMEEHIKAILRPRPRLLPIFMWKWVLSKLIYLEVKNENINNGRI